MPLPNVTFGRLRKVISCGRLRRSPSWKSYQSKAARASVLLNILYLLYARACIRHASSFSSVGSLRVSAPYLSFPPSFVAFDFLLCFPFFSTYFVFFYCCCMLSLELCRCFSALTTAYVVYYRVSLTPDSVLVKDTPHTRASLIPPWEEQCEWHRMATRG